MSRPREANEPIRVVVVEDDPDIRLGIQMLLDDPNSGSRCVGAYASADEALAHLLGDSAADEPATGSRTARTSAHRGPSSSDDHATADGVRPHPSVRPPSGPSAGPSVKPSAGSPSGPEGAASAGSPSGPEAAASAGSPSGPEAPHVVLMDIELPGTNGIEATRRLRSERVDLDVIMLTVREDDEAVFHSLCAGAIGYLIKTTPPAKLIAAIEEAFAGGAPLSPSIARRVTRSFQAVSPSPLTERETEILGRLCQGLSYREIGGVLFISERTVHSHLKNIYRKLEVHSKTEAMARAMRERWV